MLDQLTLQTFEKLVGSRLRVSAEGLEAFEAELAEAKKLLTGTDKRDPFSILLLGPEDLVLPQMIYRVENEKLGALEIFLVTVGPAEDGRMQYEAVFS